MTEIVAQVVAEVRGAGPPVVLLHGQPGTGADWEPVARLLETDFTVILPDRPGYGRTGGRATGFRGNAEVIGALLDRLGVGPATVVGHSWSGGIAMAMAEADPRRLCGLVLVGSVGPAEPVGTLDRLMAIPPIGALVAAVGLNAAGLALSLSVVRQFLDRRIRGATDESLAAMADAWRAGRVWRSYVIEQRALVYELPTLASGLALLSIPTVVLVGADDHIVPPAAGARLAASIPGARLVRIPGVGHLVPHERPDTVAEAVVEIAGRS